MMTTEQPNALRLAKWLDAMPSSGYALPNQAAAELRRLHEANQELLDALKLAQDWYDSGNENPDDFANMIKQVIALAQQQAQGCDYCNHPQYAGTKCKNCGREQPAQDQGQSCYCPECERLSKELAALKAQQQQEPVAVYVGETWCGSVVRLYEDLPLETPLYTSPPASKPWVGLTESEIEKLAVESGKATFLNDNEQTDILWFDGDCFGLARALEAKLREKNA